MKKPRRVNFLIAGAAVLLVGFGWQVSPNLLATFLSPVYYASSADDNQPVEPVLPVPPPPVTHLATPEPVRAIYMTSWVAGTPSLRQELLRLALETEVNALVIDVKDYSGNIFFPTENKSLLAWASLENRIPDLREFIEQLHRHQIYAIARIAVFQDPHAVSVRPDLAVRRSSDGAIWKDFKGVSWIDPTAKPMWDYVVTIAREAYALGFDELNFDYIRFPSDGNMKDIQYPFFDASTNTKAAALKDFFAYLDQALADLPVPLSADFFGMTTTNTDDLNIGQLLENAEPYFEFIAPMVYPSHYPTGFLNYKSPATMPYEIIYHSLNIASQRLLLAGSTPNKLRPWLQDFDLGATYNAEMIRKEKQAVYDLGLTSWMLWAPSNKYTVGALDK